jgi:hypothetical protein
MARHPPAHFGGFLIVSKQKFQRSVLPRFARGPSDFEPKIEMATKTCGLRLKEARIRVGGLAV